MDKTVLLVCASFPDPLKGFFNNASGIHGETYFFVNDASFDEAYARLTDFDAESMEADFFHAHAALLQIEFADACNALLKDFIASKQRMLVLTSKDNARFISSWRRFCAEHGLKLRVAHIRDFSLLYSDNPETVKHEFLTTVYVLRQLGNDVAHFENIGNDCHPMRLEALWKIMTGDQTVYGYNAGMADWRFAQEDFARLPAECKNMIRLFDDVPMGGTLAGVTPDLIANFAYACRKDSALQMYFLSAAFTSQAGQYTARLLSKLAAIERELSTCIVVQAELVRFLRVLKSEVEARPRNVGGILLWFEEQIKNIDTNIPVRMNALTTVQKNLRCKGQFTGLKTSGLRFGAAEHVRRLPAYRFGEILLDKSRSFTGCLSMPFALISQYRAHLQEEKKRCGAPLPVLADFSDAGEGRALTKTLTYKLGKAFIGNIASPSGWFRLPQTLRKVFREHQAV